MRFTNAAACNIRSPHQAALFSMLCEIDRICVKHRIAYQLFAGTALGAVRHGGFIPWDDDLDVVLLRPDYERFLDAAQAELDASYYVQREFSPHWPMPYSKLRLNHTACIEKFHPKDRQMHQGVYVDLFPCDSLSDWAIVRGLQFLAAKAVIAQSLDCRGYHTDSVFKKAFIRLCRPLPRAVLWRFCIQAGRKTRRVHTFFGGGSRYRKNVFDRTWLLEECAMPFESGQFPVSAHYDALLTALYGDYRTIPPPEARKRKEHAVIVDLHRSYTEYLDVQAAMTFDAPARSIR